jgi:NAD(P)-dependent dehydrogenase (short-subunit alcohol dehydrogenase family)
MDLGLKGKMAIITGGSMGIGAAVADGLAAEGVDLVLCARGDERLNQQAERIRAKYGVQCLGIATDLSRGEDIARLIQQADQHFGRLDILINNAGIGSNETVMDAPDDKWQYYWDLHVMAAIRLARAVVPLMKRGGGGVILHNASINAKLPSPTEPIYNVTKAAVMMLSKCLANELIQDNIRVNCINPGLILTQAWIDAAEKQADPAGQTWRDVLDQIAKRDAPIGRFASPQELADFFVFLCSDRASYCVGSAYYVDGGWLNVVA